MNDRYIDMTLERELFLKSCNAIGPCEGLYMKKAAFIVVLISGPTDSERCGVVHVVVPLKRLVSSHFHNARGLC